MTERLFDPDPYTLPVYDWPYPCRDCGVPTSPSEDYWVHEAVWRAAGLEYLLGGHLCIGCLEVRLGRPLVPGDFPALPINVADRWDSPRLRALKAGR